MDQPDWLLAVQREASVRSGLVVYGNTRDLFWSGTGSDYFSMPALLSQRLEQFSIRATWDRVDGLTFLNTRHERRWDEILQRRLASPTRTGQAYDVGDAGAP